MFQRLISAAALAIGVLTLVLAPAMAAPAEKSKPILIISGMITNKESDGTLAFDRAKLESMPKAEITTSTPWTAGPQVFTGVPLKALMAAAGATGTTLRVVALNNYAHEFPLSDVEAYDVLLAYTQNGKALSIREKGPLWIIYPLDRSKQLQTIEYHSRMVWQVKEIQVK